MRSILRLGIAFLFWAGLHSAASAFVRIDVDLSTQTMHVAADNGEQFEWPVSSGRPGYATPRGTFRPRAMYVMVHSAKYNNAPMPHSIFFYGQYAIHGTEAVGALGHVASHGCIRIAPENAATLFSLVSREGARITVEGSPPGDFWSLRPIIITIPALRSPLRGIVIAGKPRSAMPRASTRERSSNGPPTRWAADLPAELSRGASNPRHILTLRAPPAGEKSPVAFCRELVYQAAHPGIATASGFVSGGLCATT